MARSLVMLAVAGMMTTPVLAQTQPATTTPATGQVQPAQPQVVKKRVCTYAEEDSYSRLGGRKICKTIEVKQPAPAANGQQPAPQGEKGR